MYMDSGQKQSDHEVENLLWYVSLTSVTDKALILLKL